MMPIENTISGLITTDQSQESAENGTHTIL